MTNDALHHLHYFHVNFKSLVMKEQHPNNIDTMEQHSKMLGLRKICIPNPPQRQLFFCLHFIPTLNKFISHIWYIASCLLWFSYDPCVICFIPNACFKFRKWHLNYFHHKKLERKSTLGSNKIKGDTNVTLYLFCIYIFPKTIFSYKWILNDFFYNLLWKMIIISPIIH